MHASKSEVALPIACFPLPMQRLQHCQHFLIATLEVTRPRHRITRRQQRPNVCA